MAMPLTEPARDGPRFEHKRLLGESLAAELQAWTAARCAPDPHADASDPCYLVESVYCDSADFAIWRSRGPLRLARYRLRRYNGAAMWFLEEKLRLQERVWKRRAVCTQQGFAALCRSDGVEQGGCLPWFADRFRNLSLRPASVICYRRHAFCTPDGGRITFDRQVAAWPAAAGADPFDAAVPPVPVLEGVVLEVKHRGPAGSLLRELAGRTDVDGGCSKYGRAVQVLGLAKAALPPA
jgi:hypothetical protein